jgi:hypothetical protein
VSDPILERCVLEFNSSPGSSAERMSAVLEYLADELLRDAFPYDHSGSCELFVDAFKLKNRLLEAIRVHPETRTASYESHLAKLTGQTPPRVAKTEDFQRDPSAFLLIWG